MIKTWSFSNASVFTEVDLRVKNQIQPLVNINIQNISLHTHTKKQTFHATSIEHKKQTIKKWELLKGL